MTLRRIFSIVLSVLLLTTFASPQKKTKKSVKELIGKWSTIVPKGERSKTMITFHANGTLEYDIGAIIRGTFFLHKNYLITYFNDPKKSATEVDTSIIKIEGDTLYQTNMHRGKNILIKSVKLGKRTLGSGIFGKWLSQNFNGYKAIQEFSSDNQVLVDLIVRSINGTYTISGNSLTLNLERSPTIKFTFSIKKNVMTILQPGKNKEKKLIKIDNN
ncbi:MAG: hypothetical protein WB779_07155 [Ignavibacteriaceae bacterium]